MKKLVVLGGGESGIGAAALAKHNNWDVFVSDAGRLTADAKLELETIGISYEEGGHTIKKILEAVFKKS